MSESMIDKLRRAKAAQQGQPVPAPASPTVVVSPELTKEMKSIEEDYDNVGKVLGTCPSCANTVTNVNGSALPSGAIKHIGCPGVAVLPPDAPKPDQAAGLKHAEALAKAEAPKTGFTQPQAPADPQPPAAPVKKTRGPNKPKDLKPEETPAPQPMPEPGPSKEELEASQGLELYVDCRVKGLKLKSLEPFIVSALEALAQDAGLDDIRLAESGPMAFGKWKAYLALEVKSMVLTGTLKGAYSLRDVKESEVKQVVCEALFNHCSVYVRGC